MQQIKAMIRDNLKVYQVVEELHKREIFVSEIVYLQSGRKKQE